MNRRDTLFGLLALGTRPLLFAMSGIALPVRAQAGMRRIGLLLPNAAPTMNGAFRKRLAALGWIEGQNLLIELLHAEHRDERFAPLAQELVRRRVEVIVVSSTVGALAAKAATSTIPIVFAHVADPVSSNVVADLARPGGNITGVSNLAGDILLKQFELLKALIPRLERVAFMVNSSLPVGRMMADSLQAGVERSGAVLLRLEAKTLEEVDAAFATASRERITAMIVPPAALYIAQGKYIAELAKKYRIATAHQNRTAVAEGALVSYGIDFTDGFARTAVYVDKILRGARPGDLPVEQAERFTAAINRSTAKALGITIPQSVLVRVDEVIE